MFVRFRETKADGYEPHGVKAKRACVGRCQRRRDQRCPVKPRCRWRIGTDHGLALVPYRLHVQLAENRRVDGKVRQEHVADLGSIDGTLLSEFWAGIDADVLTAVRAPYWEAHSLWARAAFWEEAKPRLARLANRLGPDLDRLRMAIEARIPQPLQPERVHVLGEDIIRQYEDLAESTARKVAFNQKQREALDRESEVHRIFEYVEKKKLAEARARMLAGVEPTAEDREFLNIYVPGHIGFLSEKGAAKFKQALLKELPPE